MARHRQLRQAIWPAHFRWPLYRHWSTLPDDVLVRILDELCLHDFLAVRAAGSQWTQVVQRTQRWKRMWRHVRAALAWPLRHCVLQLEIETSDSVVFKDNVKQRHTIKLDLPFLDLSESMARFTLTEEVNIILRPVEAQLLRSTVVQSARIYNKKTGRAYDLQEDSGCIGTKGPLEVETNRFSLRGARKEFEYRWCLDRGPLLKNVHVIECLQDLLREEWATYYFYHHDDEDLKWVWDEAVAGELMMEQTLESQLHHLEFCLNLDDTPEGLDVAFSIKSVFPPSPSRPWKDTWVEKPAYTCFNDDHLSAHLQVAAILLLLGEPLPWFPPGGHNEHRRRQADAAALANWLKKGTCRLPAAPPPQTPRA